MMIECNGHMRKQMVHVIDINRHDVKKMANEIEHELIYEIEKEMLYETEQEMIHEIKKEMLYEIEQEMTSNGTGNDK